MHIRLFHGSTAENDQLLLSAGELTVDVERKALRLHDGETLGGFEMVGVRAYEPPAGPGPEVPIAGNGKAGFFGEVSSEEFITVPELFAAVGLSVGTQINLDTVWLKFILDNRLLFMPKLNIGERVSWNDLYARGLVYGTDDFGLFPDTTPVVQNATVEIQGFQFKVRLLKGADSDPSALSSGYHTEEQAPNAEWSRLIPPITNGTWATYSLSELGMGTGRDFWCQETADGDVTLAVLRGNQPTSAIHFRAKTQRFLSATSPRNWRPVLELVG